MAIPRSVRLDDDLEKKVQLYLEQNGIKFAHVVNMALTKFITEPQNFELKPVSKEAFLATAEKAFKKHEKAMDKLK